MDAKDIARFWSKVDVRGPDECWPWKGKLDRDGYGDRIKIKGEKMRPNRVACILAHGASDLFALHQCNYRPCCNPAHLYWGSPMRNAIDREEAGNTMRGDAHGNRRLCSAQVIEARERFERGEAKRALARAFGISQTQMRRVLDGRAWGHL